MKLLVDNQNTLKGPRALHALIVGISAYPHLPKEGEADLPQAFGLRQLSSAALTATKIARWLIESSDRLVAPLATCRLLLAAAPDELPKEGIGETEVSTANFTEFSAAAKEWREDASRNRDDVTLFYFAGHGVKRESGDHVLLLQNFGDGVGGALSQKVVRIAELLGGMTPNPKQREIARTQLYFFDACRTTPETFTKNQFDNAGSIWDSEKEQGESQDGLVRPQFFSAIPGMASYAKKDGTLFGLALLEALNGGAGIPLNQEDDDDAWGISLLALPEALNYHIDRINRQTGGNQYWEMNALSSRLIIQRLDSPPPVDVSFLITPHDAAKSASVSVRNVDEKVIAEDLRQPFSTRIPAGHYQIEVNVDAPTVLQRVVREIDAAPPQTTCPVRFKLPLPTQGNVSSA